MPATVDLITISREFGAGGSELAKALGSLLGWRVLDRELVQRVAERLRLDPQAVEKLDEHAPSLLARLVSATLLVSPPELLMPIDTTDVLSPDAVYEAAKAEVLEAAKTPPLIVVGHGGQCLFRNRPGTLHVRLVAPLEDRLRRVAGRTDLPADKLAEEARRMDERRSDYIRRYYRCDWRDDLLYDLQVNTARIAIADVATMIAATVH